MTSSEMIDRIIRAKKCGDLFTHDPIDAKQEFRNYVKQVHPDVCSDSRAEAAMEKLNKLYKSANDCFAFGTWEEGFAILLGGSFLMNYRYADTFELGKRYVGDDGVAYVLPSKHEKYYRSYLNAVSSIRYANDQMRTEMKRFMPTILHNGQQKNGDFFIVVSKTPDAVPMDLLYASLDTSFDARHSAWMISRLNNIACFLAYNKIALNGLTMANCFVSAETHSIFLLGGWWYAVNFGRKMVGTTKEVYDLMSAVEKTNKIGSEMIDIESVKYIGRKLNDKSKFLPALKTWIESGSSKSAYHEYKKWSSALDLAYGTRKFVVMTIDIDKIYHLNG